MRGGYILQGLGAALFKAGAIILMAIALGVYTVLAIGAAITGAALKKH